VCGRVVVNTEWECIEHAKPVLHSSVGRAVDGLIVLVDGLWTD
jgi:hypothetical protein